jgi:hypothetical protein
LVLLSNFEGADRESRDVLGRAGSAVGSYCGGVHGSGTKKLLEQLKTPVSASPPASSPGPTHRKRRRGRVSLSMRPSSWSVKAGFQRTAPGSLLEMLYARV